jgi:ribosomal-protein-alanine N-acetyltransferase
MEFASAILCRMLTTALYTRPALPADRQRLERLLNSAPVTHNHLDWQPAQDWLGQRPFRFAFIGNQVVGALAAPPDLPGVAWVRLLAVASGLSVDAVLDVLWADAADAIQELRIDQVNCMLLDDWITPHLRRWGFAFLNDVVVLRCLLKPRAPDEAAPAKIKLRSARTADVDGLAAVDNAAFTAPWQYSRSVIEQAMLHASIITVAELDGAIVGYQLSSGGRNGGHLARLAVRPDLQGRGIGRALVREVLDYFDQRGATSVTVNTQRDNASSLAVYRALGFEQTGEHYEVWQWRPAGAAPRRTVG